MTRSEDQPPTTASGAPAGWTTRAEQAGDVAPMRELLLAAFDGVEEADLVEALRADRTAWIDGLSQVTVEVGGAGDDARPRERILAQALLTRARVGGVPVLALAPCATWPADQRRGAGSAAIRAVLDAARERLRGTGADHDEDDAQDTVENLVVVLGHAAYYPRFGFRPASQFGVTAPFDVPDEAFMALALDPELPTPRGEIVYAAAFGG